MTDVLTYKVRVTIEKEITVHLPAHFASDEYLMDFREGLWFVEDVGEVAQYAARMAAEMGSGYEHDGLGLLSYSYSEYPRVPDVKFEVDYEDVTAEILEQPK
jgi:hypothetical protein